MKNLIKKIHNYIRHRQLGIYRWPHQFILEPDGFGFYAKTYWSIRNFFWPQCSFVLAGWNWREWHDKDEVIQNILFNSILDFVERESGGVEKFKEELEWRKKDSPGCGWTVAYQEIFDLYQFIKGYKKEELRLLDLGTRTGDYSHHNDFEKRLDEACQRIVKVKNYLWT